MKLLGTTCKPFEGNGSWSQIALAFTRDKTYLYAEKGAVEGEGYYCDYLDSPGRWTIIISGCKERMGDTYKTYYYVNIQDTCREMSLGETKHNSLKEAKRAALEAFPEFMCLANHF